MLIMYSRRNIFILTFLFALLFSFKTYAALLYHEKNFINKETNYSQNEKDKNLSLTYTIEKENIIHVKNNVISVFINTITGDIQEVRLLNYKKSINSNTPISLLKKKPNFLYEANSYLIESDNLNNNSSSIKKPIYKLLDNKHHFNNLSNQEITISLIAKDKDHTTYIKTFVLKPNEYSIKVEYNIQNHGKTKNISVLNQLKQSVNTPEKTNNSNSFFIKNTYRGAAYSSDQHTFQKRSFEDIQQQKNEEIHTKNGWIAMIQQYFCTAWIPNYPEKNTFFTKKIGTDKVSINSQSDIISIKKNSSHKLSSILWVGPELQEKMKSIAPYLDSTIDYGYLWFISKPLFQLMNLFHNIIHNWGLAIALTTLTIRIFMYPLTKYQYTSSMKMRLLQPKIQKIQKKYKHDNKRIRKEIISIYKKENINPIASLLTSILQMPLFLSLYYMLISSVELRHSPLLWIQDLSSKDPYFILPILMGLTMFFVQKTSPTDNSESNKQLYSNFIPIMFSIFFLWFPSSLVLYYAISNLVTIIQQQFIFNEERKSLSEDVKQY